MGSDRRLPKRVLTFCQATWLLWALVRHGFRALWCLLCAFVRALFRAEPESYRGVEFYEGTVSHSRAHEGSHSFTYAVRMAVVDLDAPPTWFTADPARRLSAQQARQAAGTSGRVRLLTTPVCAGYDQNPIQVYYCEDENCRCSRAVAEVTNTPWNHRVHFAFDNTLETGATLAKPLHVSPMMDINQRWRIRAPPPCDGRIELDVDVLPPLSNDDPMGAEKSHEPAEAPLLRARLRLCRGSDPHTRVEYGGSLKSLWRFGLQPHRTAVRIYMNALMLLRKGIKFRGHPPPSYKEGVLERGRLFASSGASPPSWNDNGSFPWGARWSNKQH